MESPFFIVNLDEIPVNLMVASLGDSIFRFAGGTILLELSFPGKS